MTLTTQSKLVRKICFSACLAVSAAPAQQPVPASNLDFHVHAKQNPISTDEVIRNFEAPKIEAYSIEAGDEITIEVWGHPDLSGHHVIGPDGKITVPVSGTLKLAGLTREGAEAMISKSLAAYYSDLSITLRIDRYTSFRVYVLGRVANPGALQFESQPTLLDVITKSGALPIGGVGADKTALGRCAIVRNPDKMIWVDLRTLLSQGNLTLNIRLARNDLVYIPDAGEQLVYVLGQVVHPGAIRLTPEMSFMDAFMQAGGATDDAAADKITLVRGNNAAERQFRLKDLLANPRELNFGLNEGDIIYVPERGLGKMGYILQKASPITGFAVIGTLAK